jgi:hypothetical protein
MQQIETKKLLALGGVALVLGIVQNILFFDQGIGLNYPLFILCVLIGAFFLGWRPSDRLSGALVVLAVVFAAFIFIRSSQLLTFFNVLGSALLLLMLADSHLGKKLREYVPGDYLKTFILPFIFIPYFFKSVSEFFDLRKLGVSSPRAREIVRGTLAAVVALVIFGALFASADLVFGRFLKNLFSIDISEEFMGRTIMLVFVTAFLLAAFRYALRTVVHNGTNVTSSKPKSLGMVETSIVLTSINVLFFGFIMVQLTYLFGGESHVVSQGLTYAEYARKGFFELILVAILSFVIISVAEKQVIKKENSHTNRFKILSTILIAQVVIILISAFARLSLYEHAYGFTTIRLYSYALMIWMAVVLVFLAHHIVTSGERAKFALKVFCCVVVLLLAMNALNPDAFIAKRNLERYAETGKIDPLYLANLSIDALPYTVSLLNNPDEKVQKEFSNGVYHSTYIRLENDTWKSSQLMKPRAGRLLVPYREILEKFRTASSVPPLN